MTGAPGRLSMSGAVGCNDGIVVSGVNVDVEGYERDGYCVVRAVLDTRTVAALHAATNALELAGRDFVVDTRVGPVFFEVQSVSGRKREPAVAPGVFRKITGPSKSQPAFMRLKNNARIVAVVRALGLVHPRCVVDQVNFKHPRVGTGFPFHQDSAFLHGDAAHALAAHGGVNVVVALDAADAGNGGFVVLGRTHTAGQHGGQHGYDTSTMNDHMFDATHRAVPSLAPGDAVFFHPHLAHGSEPNRSDRRRRLATLWFVGGGGDDGARGSQ
jgi:ectoine hydroxylase-related dioxygenase (phytanoyl-CoA dioxygenase family)